MCGIAGFVDFRGHSDEGQLKKMTNILTHRGPDDAGYFVDNHPKASIGLGHRRLSILDLSHSGHQPMHFRDLTIIFNGEVYNFQEIREELIKEGYTFNSDSDTEVILKAYNCWNLSCISKFNGMFAMGIYDKTANKLTLIRDRAGVKPLYWYHDDELLLFASELKSFHEHPGFTKKIDLDGFRLFFKHGYILQPYTIFQNTWKLRSGHYLVIDLDNGGVVEHKYWDVTDYYKEPKLNLDKEEVFEETERLLTKACNYRMVADVPVGIFLSGGYDSSIVTALIQKEMTEKLKTFTIGFEDEKFNEAHHALAVAKHLGTDHHEYYCSKKDILDIFPRLSQIWDEPFGDPSVIPTTLVSKLARQDVTVSLSADGGDELFGGYNKYTGIRRRIDFFRRFPKATWPLAKAMISNTTIQHLSERFGFNQAEKRMSGWARTLGMNEKDMLKDISDVFGEVDFNSMVSKDFDHTIWTEFDSEINTNWLDNLLALDYKTYQADNILTKVDRATMSVSLEGREPLLDFNLVEFVARLDPSFKIHEGEKKYLLKKITHKYIPEEIMNRPKMGFGAPILTWMRTDLRSYLMTYLSEENIRKSEFFNVSEVIKIRDNYLQGNNSYVTKVWLLLLYHMWQEKWMQ